MENHKGNSVAPIFVGNAEVESRLNKNRGWFVGNFAKAGELHNTNYVEVKWGIHEPKEIKMCYGMNQTATTLTILIKGKFVLEFPESQQEIYLNNIGDYAICAPKVLHGWRAIKKSIILTIRWPSLPDDQYQISRTDEFKKEQKHE